MENNDKYAMNIVCFLCFFIKNVSLKKGYALVEFVKPESTNDCCNLFNGLKLWGKPLYIYPLK